MRGILTRAALIARSAFAAAVAVIIPVALVYACTGPPLPGSLAEREGLLGLVKVLSKVLLVFVVLPGAVVLALGAAARRLHMPPEELAGRVAKWLAGLGLFYCLISEAPALNRFALTAGFVWAAFAFGRHVGANEKMRMKGE